MVNADNRRTPSSAKTKDNLLKAMNINDELMIRCKEWLDFTELFEHEQAIHKQYPIREFSKPVLQVMDTIDEH